VGKTKKLKKHTFYLDTEEIFPRREMTPEDVVFIEFILAKLEIDLESEDDVEFFMSTNQILFLVRGIMREYNIFLGNGVKFEE
jgi:uridine kinase